MIDLERKLRRIERCLGVPVVLRVNGEESGTVLVVDDHAQSGFRFTQPLGTESRWDRNISKIHEVVYRARGRKKFEDQRGICALCGKPMSGTENTETDHIESRGAHGRDDSLSNLRVVHGEPCHRMRHNGRT